MMAIYKPKCIALASGVLIALLVLCWTGSPDALEASNKGSGTDTGATGELVVLKKKRQGAVWGERQRFLVSDSTRIFDLAGEKMTFNTLPVPCRARISTLSKLPEGFHIGEIRVIEVLPGASSTFYAPLPE